MATPLVPGFIIANDNPQCADIPFPAIPQGIDAAIAWLKVLGGMLDLNGFVQTLVALGLPPQVIAQFAQAAMTCIGRGA